MRGLKCSSRKRKNENVFVCTKERRTSARRGDTGSIGAPGSSKKA